MRQIKNAVLWNTKKVSVGMCLLAAAPVVAGCSGTAEGTDPSGSPAAVRSSQPAASQSPSGGPSNGKGGGQPDAKAAVSKWVAAIVANHLKKACMVMAIRSTNGSPPKPNTPQMCGDSSAHQMQDKLRKLQKSFTPAHPQKPPQVEVADGKASGGSVTVSGDQITVDGQSLKAIVLSHSTGVNESDFDINVKAGNIGSKWYVTDFRISVG
jgi:hypothetical protein